MATSTRDGHLAGAGPLWRRLADDLRRRIAAGEFEAAFPGELALVEQYGVSRHTVREALRGLRQDGLVTSARGRPSRIAPPTLIEQPTSSLYSLFASVRQAGLTQRSIVRARDTRLDPTAAAALGLGADADLFYLERLRMAGQQPLALDRVWLPVDLARPLLDVDFGDTSLYGELRRACGITMTGGRERVTAEIPDPAVRRELGIGTGVAVFRVDRTGFRDAEPVEWRETVLRGDLFSMTTHYPHHRPGEL